VALSAVAVTVASVGFAASPVLRERLTSPATAMTLTATSSVAVPRTLFALERREERQPGAGVPTAAEATGTG
jgi:hypothetical protein